MSIIPLSIRNLEYATSGERKVHDYFTLLPDNYTTRYQMIVSERNRKSSYTIFSRTHGIAIIEIAECVISTLNADKLLRKCDDYLDNIRKQVYSNKEFINNSRRLDIPVDYIFVFTAITREQFVESGKSTSIPEERIIFSDDMITSEKFLLKYHSMFPPLHTPLSEIEMKCMEETLLPDLRISTIKNPFSIDLSKANGKNENLMYETYQLSKEQEAIAKNLGEGTRLLRGIAGTGKTMILLYRAKLLASARPYYKILILCWNVSLARYMRQVYDSINLPGGGNVEITNYTKFVFKSSQEMSMVDDSVEFTEKCMKTIMRDSCMKYDAVFIDEGQDFKESWLTFIYTNLLKGARKGNLLIASDNAQSIYTNKDINWKEIGIPMTGRSKVLRTIYRNCKKIWFFAHFFLGDESLGLDSTETNVIDKLSFASAGDYDPVLMQCETEGEQVRKVISIINQLSADGISPGNVLIIYSSNGHRGFQVEKLISGFDEAGIGYEWITESRKAKRGFQWESPQVKISTAASAKGMDAPVVIILGAENFNTGVNPGDAFKLMYVALTRAREVLVVLHTHKSEITDCLYAARKRYYELSSLIMEKTKKKLAS